MDLVEKTGHLTSHLYLLTFPMWQVCFPLNTLVDLFTEDGNGPSTSQDQLYQVKTEDLKEKEEFRPPQVWCKVSEILRYILNKTTSTQENSSFFQVLKFTMRVDREGKDIIVKIEEISIRSRHRNITVRKIQRNYLITLKSLRRQ